MSGRHCSTAKKRKYNSRAAALRAGAQRYGNEYARDAYRCGVCGCWHLTRSGVPQADADPQLERLVDVALGKVGTS